MIDWKRAILAGVIAGIVFAVMEMILVATALGGSAWGPPRMMAAIVMGQGVLPPPPSFDLGIVLVGLIVHMVLSVLYAIIIAFAVRNLGTGAAIGVGAAIGLAIYLVNFYGFTMIFEWFANARNWVTILSHLVFGAVAAWYYRKSAEAHPAPA